MNEKINFAMAKYAAAEVLEGLIATQHAEKYRDIHLDTVEQNFVDLARELGFAVYPLPAYIDTLPRGASLAEEAR